MRRTLPLLLLLLLPAAARCNPLPLNAPSQEEAQAAQRFLADVRWLADDAREGRGLGTRGLEESARWLAERFREIGLEPAGDDGTYLQAFNVPVAVEVAAGTEVTVDGKPVARADFQPAGFSSSSAFEGEVVLAGYGITAPELGVDDYKGVEVKGKIALVRRFTPEGGPFSESDVERRYGDLRYKAWNAREHGAKGLIVIDLPAAASPGGGEPPAEAPLPAPGVETGGGILGAGDAGLPVVFLSRAAGAGLAAGAHRARLAVDLKIREQAASNVVGRLRAGADTGGGRLPGAVLVGAHYDHLGIGGGSSGTSLDPDVPGPRNGADDNASGTAGVLEIARRLAAERGKLRRDVYFVAFSAEEVGVLGSTAFTRHPAGGLKLSDLVAMLNLDMVGRLRGNILTVLGSESAGEWRDLVSPACERALLACTMSGDGYGPSDQSPFYAAGVPVLHFFTGAHEDYHKVSDDTDKINAEGGARIAGLVADLAGQLAGRTTPLTLKTAAAPLPLGDARSYGASLGTIPDYSGDGRPGVLLAGVRPGSGAEKAGMQRGDLLVELAGTPVRSIYDFMFVLRKSKPGETVRSVVMRGEERLELTVTFGSSRGR